MARHRAIALVTIGLLLSSSTAAATPTRTGAFELIGYSINNMVPGGSGYVGLTQACGAEIPSSSVRVCATEEFIKSLDIFSPANDAWIDPVHIGASGFLSGGGSDIRRAASMARPMGNIELGVLRKI